MILYSIGREYKRLSRLETRIRLLPLGYALYCLMKGKHMDDLDLAKIKTAVNICTGDDGHKANEVVETLQQLLKMTLAEYYETWQNYG